MPTFEAPDGTRLAYRVISAGEPLVCVPGGPADSRYLGDLGGLSAYRQLIVLDLRGTGLSAMPADPDSYRCDRQVDDVEALREHLGLPRIDLLAHSAGANIAAQYAVHHPGRVRRLVLVTPSLRAVGIEVTGAARRDLALRRHEEPWFPRAWAALTAITEGVGDDWDAIAPFSFGRWDAVAQAHHSAWQRSNVEAVAGFGADGAFTPAATRAALADLEMRTLLVAGEFDVNSPPSAVTEFGALFRDATVVLQPGAGHYPWLDDAARFTATVSAALEA